MLTAFSMNPTWYFAARFLTGTGIGGEYAAINSAIDELIPAKYRGRVDVAINGSFWVGAAGGALLTIPLLDPNVIDQGVGWRLAFGLGAILAVGILIVRRNVPESPRWLFIHGREDEGEQIVRDIERTVVDETGKDLPTVERDDHHPAASDHRHRRDRPHRLHALPASARCCASRCSWARRSSTTPSSSPTATPSSTFFDVKQTGWYIAVFAASNFAGALLLSPLFDRLRPGPDDHRHLRALRACCSRVAGFVLGDLNAVTLTVFGAVIFFFASAGASAAYLTASEVFPMETRALCIAFFYAIGTAVGGISRTAAVRQADRQRLGRPRTSPRSRSATSSAPR